MGHELSTALVLQACHKKIMDQVCNGKCNDISWRSFHPIGILRIWLCMLALGVSLLLSSIGIHSKVQYRTSFKNRILEAGCWENEIAHHESFSNAEIPSTSIRLEITRYDHFS